MAQIEYCDDDVRTVWHPAFGLEPCAHTDDWLSYSDVRRSDPEDINLVFVSWSEDDANDNLRREFGRLAEEWRKGTKFTPTLRKIVIHPAYQRIMALGKPVLQYIFEDLAQNGPDHWFWALHFITNQDPARGTDTIDEAAAAWLRWAREQGYVF